MVQLEDQQKGETAGSAGAVFRRLLVVVDDSAAGDGALDFTRDWTRAFHAEARLFELEANGATGRSNRGLVAAIADAAEDFRADVIVLGCERRRLAHHRLGPSLRSRLARVTDVPVLVLPPGQGDKPKDLGEKGLNHHLSDDAASSRSFARV